MSSLADTRARGFWRLVWKEVRQYRAFFLTLLSTGVLLQLVALSAELGSLPILLIAGVFPVMCCLAIAATAFAGEHDNATFLGLRALPASNRDILASKLTVAAGAALVVLLVLWLMVFLFRDRVIGPGQAVVNGAEVGDWLLSSLALIAEILIYGALLSLYERNALVAVVKTIAVVILVRLMSFAIPTLVVFGLVGIGVLTPFESPDRTDQFVFGASWTIRALGALAGAVVMVGAARQWYSGGRLAVFPWLQRWRDDARPKTYTAAQTAPGAWRRLAWLQTRYFGWIGLAMMCGVVVVFIWERGFQTNRGLPRTELSIAAVVVASILVGGLTFRAAQAQKNFLASMGVAAWRVWLSQLLLPLATCTGLVVLFASFFPHAVTEINRGEWFFWGFAIMLLGFFAWGLLCSQQTRSALPALAWSALAATLVGSGCYALNLFSFESPQLQRIGLAVLAGYPVVEALLRAPGWLAGIDFRTWRWIGIRTAFFSLLAVATVWVFETEIPYFSNEQIGLAQNHGIRPDTTHFAEISAIGERLEQSYRESNAQVRAAHPNVDISSNELAPKLHAAWYAARRNELEPLLELPYHDFGAQFMFQRASLPANAQRNYAETYTRIANFMRVALNKAIDAGDVVLAERIMRKEFFRLDPVQVARWAWLEGNDVERIRNLIHFIQTELDPRQSAIWSLSGLYQWSVPSTPNHRFSHNPFSWLQDVITVPRENRAMRQNAAQLPQVLDEYHRAIDSGEGFYHLYLESELSDEGDERSLARRYRVGGRYLAYLTTQRFAAVQLAAIAWLREHPGERLESLDQLVPGILAKIPLDPYTGKQPIFERGLETRVYPDSVWTETQCPTSSMFLFSPGGMGVERITTLINVYRGHPQSASTRPEIIWGYRDHEFYFYVANAQLNALYGRQNLIAPGDGYGRFFPIELSKVDEPQFSNGARGTTEETP